MFGEEGRSNYNFQFNTDMKQVDLLIQNYLKVNSFSQFEKNGERFYMAGNQSVGYRGFKYIINGNNLSIEAWIMGAKDFKLEQNSMNAVASNYKASLNTLFQELTKLNSNNQNSSPNTGQPLNNAQAPQNDIKQNAQTLQNEIIKLQEKQCEICFWMSIIGFLCSFIGVTYGAVIYICDFYFALLGLKTKKRKKAIATIVLSIISIIVIILGIVI